MVKLVLYHQFTGSGVFAGVIPSERSLFPAIAFDSSLVSITACLLHMPHELKIQQMCHVSSCLHFWHISQFDDPNFYYSSNGNYLLQTPAPEFCITSAVDRHSIYQGNSGEEATAEIQLQLQHCYLPSLNNPRLPIFTWLKSRIDLSQTHCFAIIPLSARRILHFSSLFGIFLPSFSVITFREGSQLSCCFSILGLF